MHNNKLRVCLISSEYPPETGGGGIGTYTHNLAHGLASDGHHVTVISRSITGIQTTTVDEGVRLIRIAENKLPFKGLGRVMSIISGNSFFVWWYSVSIFEFIDKLIKIEGSFDIIEGPLWGAECAAYKRSINVPLVVRLQTPIFKSKQLLNQRPDVILEFLEKRSLNQATQIAAISENVRDLIISKYRITPAKFVMAPLGIKGGTPRDTKHLGTSPNVLYVGRLEVRKGTSEFIDSLNKILRETNVKIQIVGKDCMQAPNGLTYQEYFRSVVSKEYYNRVSFLGFVSDSERAELFENADIFIAPSRYESFGLVFLEAMSYGIPVVGTKVGGIPEIIDNSVGRLIKVNDHVAISDAIIELSNNEELRLQLGKNARIRYLEKFTVDKMVENTVRLYSDTIAKHNQK